MNVLVNGERQELPAGSRVADLVPVERRWIAVSLDGEVVPRSAWDETELAEGQRVEILEARAGG